MPSSAPARRIVALHTGHDGSVGLLSKLFHELRTRRQRRLIPAPLDPRLKGPLEQAHARWDAGDWQAAAELLSDALERLPGLRTYPDKARLHADLAMVLAEPRPTDALAHARYAAEFSPD